MKQSPVRAIEAHVKRKLIVLNTLFYGALVLAIFLAFGAFAQAVDPGTIAPVSPIVTPPAGLEWLVPFLQWIGSLPKVGPVVVDIMKYVGAAAAVFTALSVAVTTVLRVPALIARWAGATETAAKIELFYFKIKPWLDYLSIFNVQQNKQQ